MQSSICSDKIVKACSRWALRQIIMMVSTTASLKAMLGSSFRQSARNFRSTPAFCGILKKRLPVDWMVSILNSMPKSGRYALIYLRSLPTCSSLQVFSKVLMARLAMLRLGSVIRVSNSCWQVLINLGCF
jgi:hypothetical protein